MKRNTPGANSRKERFGRQLVGLDRALRLHAEPPAWRKLMLNAMNQRFDWREPARRYLDLYRRLAPAAGIPAPAGGHAHERTGRLARTAETTGA